MEPRQYQTAIFGATFLGLGAALAMDDCVVLESGASLCADFAGSYRIVPPRPPRPRSALGKRFALALSRQGNGAGQPVRALRGLLQGRSVTPLLGARVLRIVREDGAYRLRVCHDGRLETFTAQRLLDSTAYGLSHPGASLGPVQKTLNALVYNPDARALPNLRLNPATGLYTYAHTVRPTASRQEAIASLLALEPDLSRLNMRIADIATNFTYSMRPFVRRLGKNWLWSPSAAYESPVEAFDKGCRIAQGWGFACINNVRIKSVSPP